jgi:type IV fimbrial biogenesis protein FimT
MTRMADHTGFTIVEVLLVVMIIAILSTVAAPQLHGLLANYRLNGAAQALWGDLHRARIMAIKEGRTFRLEVDSPTSYTLVRADTAQIAVRRSLSPEYAGITVAIPGNTVAFDRTGLRVGDGQTVTIQGPAKAKSVTILPTGSIGKIS